MQTMKVFPRRSLIKTVHRMAELGWIELRLGSWKQKEAATIAVLDLDLIGLEYCSEPKEGVIARRNGKQVNIEDFFDQEAIGKMKAEIREINEFIEGAELSWVGEERDSQDLSNRELQRIFNVLEGFTEEDAEKDYVGFGRLYGSFWVGMKKTLRPFLRIDEEELALLDFSSMNVHLAYYLAGENPPGWR